MQITSEEDILDPAIRKSLLLDIVDGEEVDRRDECLKAHEIYHDRQGEYVAQALQQEGMSEAAIVHMTNRSPSLSILRKLINKKARVYGRAPERKLDGASVDADGEKVAASQQGLLDELAQELELDMTMKKANRWLELHKNTLVHVKPVRDRDASREAGNDLMGLRLEVWNPSVYSLIADPDDETRPLVVIFSWFDDNTASGVQSNSTSEYRDGDSIQQGIGGPSRDKGETDHGDEGVFVWWSPSFNFTTNSKGEIIDSAFPEASDFMEQVRNPIGMLPFVNFTKDQNMNIWAEGGMDLVNGATLINVLLADLYYISKFQGMGLLTITGKDIPKNIGINPHQALVIPHEEGDPQPQVSFASSNPPIAAHISMIEQLTAMLLTTNDLEPGAISGTLSATNASSGIQEIIQRSEPTSAIEDDQAIFIRREPRIMKLAVAWAKVLTDAGIANEKTKEFSKLTDTDYTLILPEPEPFANEEARINAIIKKKDAGLMTTIAALRELNPEMDMDMARRTLEEIKAEKEANAAAFNVPEAKPFEKKEDEDMPKDDESE